VTTELDEVHALAHARIVIVEDEAIVARDIEQSLRGFGYAVVGVVDTGTEALRLCAEKNPNLVLMDIRLRGDPDGIEAAREIRERFDVPVVFLTAHADEATLDRAREVAPFGYVLKPFVERELHVAIMMALAKHRAFADLDRAVRARTEELIRSETRFRRMSALAELGIFAIRTTAPEALVGRAVAVVAETLEVDLAKIVELLPGGEEVAIRAVTGYDPSVIGQRIPAAHRSQAGYTLHSGEPVVSEDVRAESRFDPAEIDLEHGAVSGASVVVHSPGRQGHPYGVLAVHSRARRSFTAYEVQFLQAVANVVASAVERAESDEALRSAQRKRDEEHLRALQAEQAVRMRDEFMAVASHELRTPLAALQLRLQSMAQSPEQPNARSAERIEAAVRSAHRLGDLVETLLELPRIASGRLALTPELFDLAESARAVLERLRPLASQAHCQLELATEPVLGRWDRSRIEQVVSNLLSNAFKYGRECPVRMQVRAGSDEAVLTVEDGGPGVDQRDVERIFDRFERASSVQHHGGLGLGLYIARELVQAHGGTIGVESVPGRGARFIVRLPRGVS
jgi:signal transduction histidine kinase/AmiR/NasT family two-component response regulator